MMKKWDIEGVIITMTSNISKQEEAMGMLKDAMKKEMTHSKALKEKKLTKFHRTSKASDKIGDNYREMKTLQMTADKGF
jgi:hypothetical protein